jgi:hypothetical protein
MGSRALQLLLFLARLIWVCVGAPSMRLEREMAAGEGGGDGEGGGEEGGGEKTGKKKSKKGKAKKGGGEEEEEAKGGDDVAAAAIILLSHPGLSTNTHCFKPQRRAV